MHANHSKSFAKLTMLDLLPIWGFPQIIDNTFCALDNDEGAYIVHPKQNLRQFVYCKHVKHENNCWIVAFSETPNFAFSIHISKKQAKHNFRKISHVGFISNLGIYTNILGMHGMIIINSPFNFRSGPLLLFKLCVVTKNGSPTLATGYTGGWGDLSLIV